MSDGLLTGALGDVRVRRPRLLSPLREHLRDTMWFAPTAGLVGSLVLWWIAAEVDAEWVRLLQEHEEYDAIKDLNQLAEDTKVVISTIGSAMMTFIGVVFSISLVAVQMASGQFSPRVVRLYVRSRITKATLTVFLATFLFSLMTLTSFDSEQDPRLVTNVPIVEGLLALLMVLLSLLLFVAYVNGTLRMMRIGFVIDRIAREAFRVAAKHPAEGHIDDEQLGPQTARIVHEGQAGVLRDVHIARAVRAARRQGVVLRLLPRTGDFVVPGTPVFTVHGGPPPGLRALRYTVYVGVERTFHQDLGFGLRQLSDIALRALSPAVNDPTTAVQALDRIVQFLAVLAPYPLGALRHRDRRGEVRLIQPVPDWTDLVDLGLTEIRGCAPGNPQVTRRMLAGIDDLLLLAPEERRTPLLRHRALLEQAVERVVPETADREFALLPDRQGIG
ncbi:DUF2254 domain-containing protein [Streptomyces spectabilis]|uniref:DUF2254 domain-containing protein n=1 Tax=Streptomyces spectabilis TaxID=68270 RepID=A0A5P2XDC7_STRST|nr:DUF2254 domain-containing protein [Streptomyces spectabilis]MBB5107109.1 putative membrane protein [Streptomyces spectabilis]MCI3906157.1 DUF2254 domain-containing protein [Streptomyces spectabilis]QEV63037.1 DUF2254 domain-containing protein [Streptomyces spectabilis]GGV04527.1 hypothetical protein GCM10010245_09740 [Streptomyces spectabilis]